MRTRRTWTVAAIALAVALTGCGDDDDAADDGGSATEADATEPDEATEDDAAADDGDGEGGGDAGGEGAASVTMVDFAFDPEELTVASGGSVAVANQDSASHTFTSEEGGFDLELGGGESGEVTVDAEPGDYDFLCTIHPSMTGTLTVE